ncbi:SMP-30/gluconolactonase/LRE family protein [Paraglaciecola sp.]|uniref:SMP-30/gluconolactonase/LRE family protein n=1 Tax=Paraglaciecola sp. TaxID=1920173 RepID=UPI0030F491B3
MLNNFILEQQLSVANILGEGVIWDHRSQLVYWTDINNKLLYSATFDGGMTIFPCPEKLCSFGLCHDPQWLICAFASGFAFFKPSTLQIQWVAKCPVSLPNLRMNDGRVDRQGRFWAGSMVEPPLDEPLSAALYRLELDGSLSEQRQGVEIANSLCWSPTADKIYFADSPKRCIEVADFDLLSGDIGQFQIFASTERGAYPDGACIDSEGCLWSAQWGSSSVKRYNPEGQLLLTLTLPCQQPSCVSFAGPELKHLCVTSARQGLKQNKVTKHDGDLFIYSTPYIGLPEAICRMEVPNI